MKRFLKAKLQFFASNFLAGIAGIFSIICFLAAPLRCQNVTATLSAGTQPQAVAVNPVTNRIYVAVAQGAAVIDGSTGAVSTVAGGINPSAVAINAATNMTYLVNQGSNTVTVIDGRTNTVAATVKTDTGPDAVAVNSVTNQIYVANRAGSSVTVIDGASNKATNISLGAAGIDPVAVAVNPVSNKIYVVENAGTVAVINGSDNTFANVTVGSIPVALAVNPVTNKIYVANSSSNTVTVIDGSDNGTTPVTVGTNPQAVSVNPVINKVYVVNAGSNTLTVIDGATNGTASVTVDTLPQAVAVDALTNQIYVANFTSGTVTIVDGATNTAGASSLSVGSDPIAIGVNPVTNKMYVANQHSNSVSVIDGATNATNLVTVGSGPIAADVNPVTNKIYVANQQDSTVTVIDGASNTAAPPITVDTNPEAVAVNPLTNKIYVASQANPTVTVIDGATNASTTITLPVSSCPCATGPTAVAVDTVLNQIYVANDNNNTATVIDGFTNQVSAVLGGANPSAIAVDPGVFKIYIANRNSKNVTVLDLPFSLFPATTTVGAGTNPESIAVNTVTNQVFVADNGSNDLAFLSLDVFNGFMSDPALNQPQSIAVNPASSQIWVANNGSNTATVFAGANGPALTVTVGNNPDGLVVNPVTNKVYLSNFTDNTISAIDGASNNTFLSGTAGSPVTLTAGTAPGKSVTNPVTNMTYVTNFKSSNVTVITEQNTQAIPLTTNITPLPDDQTTSATPTFTFGTSSTYFPNAPTPQNVFFQVDTWQGPWIAASGAHPTFTGTTPTLGLGPHIIYVFATDGQSQDSEGSGAIGQIQAYYFTVVRLPASVALTSSKNPVGFGGDLTFTATVSSTDGTPTDGAVEFLDGTTHLGFGNPIGPRMNQSIFFFDALKLGSHSITAVYGGDATFARSTSPVLTQVVLNPSGTSEVSSPNPSLPGQFVSLTATVQTGFGLPTPTGTVVFMDGTDTLATNTLTGNQTTFVTSSLAAGLHEITAVYSGDSNYASSSSPVEPQVILCSTTTSVTSNFNPSTPTQDIDFAATIRPTCSGKFVVAQPDGQVTFMDGDKVLGIVTGGDPVQFFSSPLALGSHSITAIFAGDGNYLGSTSPPFIQMVSQPPDFGITTSSQTATVTAGGSATFNLTITPNNGFISPISFSCSGQPATVSCGFNPPTVTPSGTGSVATVLTVSTAANAASLNKPSFSGNGLWWPGALGLAGLVLAWRNPRVHKGRRGSLWLGVLLCLVLAGLSGCGGGGGNQPPPTTITFNAVATSGSTSHSTSITLTITH